MAIRKDYRAGDFLRQCERTGFTVYASDTRKEWTGHIIRLKSYEQRNAQEFVRGMEDYQSVWEARPLFGGDNAVRADGTINFIGPVATTLTAATNAGGTVLTVTSSTGMTAADDVRVTLRDGEMHPGTISTVDSSTQITLTKGLSGTATAGGTVQDISAVTTATGGF